MPTTTCTRCSAPFEADALRTRFEGMCPRCLVGGILMEPRFPSKVAIPGVEILERVGHGGMAAVYRARHAALDRVVAVKILARELGDDPDFAERFTREARTLAKLDHPNVVAVHDVGVADGWRYIVMEYVEGRTLRQRLQEALPGAGEAVSIVKQLASALDAAHAQGIVHRDVKPENVLIAGDRVKLVDFGIARRAGDDRVTAPGATFGTADYMAPEQRETAAVDARADVYSLGVVFYEMLTGRRPHGRFAMPSESSRALARFDPVVARALAQDPDDRYATAGAMAAALEGRRAGSLIPILALLAAAAIVTVAVWLGRGPTPQDTPTTVKKPDPLVLPEPEQVFLSITNKPQDGPLASEPMPENFTLGFEVRFDAAHDMEPWILVVAGEAGVFLFPHGDHSVTFAVQRDGGWMIRPAHLLPKEVLVSGAWTRVEIARRTVPGSPRGEGGGEVVVSLDGKAVMTEPVPAELFTGPWRFQAAGRANEVRFRRVELRRP
jgi:serine/threonine protein kinase